MALILTNPSGSAASEGFQPHFDISNTDGQRTYYIEEDGMYTFLFVIRSTTAAQIVNSTTSGITPTTEDCGSGTTAYSYHGNCHKGDTFTFGANANVPWLVGSCKGNINFDMRGKNPQPDAYTFDHDCQYALCAFGAGTYGSINTTVSSHTTYNQSFSGASNVIRDYGDAETGNTIQYANASSQTTIQILFNT